MNTVTEDGRALPFVVRVESSTINRGIARMSVLDDPAARGADAPFTPAQWDRNVYYVFGESCGPGYQQGSSDVNIVLGALELGKISADNLLINLVGIADRLGKRSEEHTSELQLLMRNSYAVICLKKKKHHINS